jgi:ABC-type molybdate transport system substrate-binding protein
MLGRIVRSALACAVLALPLGGWISPAPDVVVYTLPGLRGPVGRLADDFRRRTGVRVFVYAAPPAGIVGLVRHRARADVVVADAATVHALADAALITQASVAALGADPYVLVEAAGAAPEPAAAALGRLHAVATDPTSAADFDGMALLASLMAGGAPKMPPIGVAETTDVVAAVAAQAGLVGLVRASDASGAGGVSIVATLPLSAPIAAGLTKNGQSGRAGEFLRFVTSPRGDAVLHAGGIE